MTSDRQTMNRRQEGADSVEVWLSSVERVLGGYGARGVLRSWSREAVSDVHQRFTFAYPPLARVRLEADGRARMLVLRGVLPDVPRGESLEREVRSFVTGLSDAARPAHRRLDPAVAQVSTRRSGASLSLAFRDAKDASRATHAVVATLHELAVWLQLAQADYLWTHFESPRE